MSLRSILASAAFMALVLAISPASAQLPALPPSKDTPIVTPNPGAGVWLLGWIKKNNRVFDPIPIEVGQTIGLPGEVWVVTIYREVQVTGAPHYWEPHCCLMEYASPTAPADVPFNNVYLPVGTYYADCYGLSNPFGVSTSDFFFVGQGP